MRAILKSEAYKIINGIEDYFINIVEKHPIKKKYFSYT